MVGGGGKMAELMLLSEIADPTRFFTDNLLSPEDWGARSEARGEGAGCSRRGGPRRAGRPQRVGEEGWSDAEPSVCGRRSGALAFPGCGRKDDRGLPREEARGCPGVGGQGLGALGCVAQRVGGRWVWPGRANGEWSRG